MGFGGSLQPAGARTLREIFLTDVRLPNVPVETIMSALEAEGLDDVSGKGAAPATLREPSGLPHDNVEDD